MIINKVEIEEALLRNGIEVVKQKNFNEAVNKINSILSKIFSRKDLVIEGVIVRFEFFIEVGRFFVIDFLFDATGNLSLSKCSFSTMYRSNSYIYCAIFTPSEDFYNEFGSSSEPYFHTINTIESILKRHEIKLNVSLLVADFMVPFDIEIREYLI